MAEIRRLRIDEAPLVRQLVRLAIDDMARTYPEDDVGISERGLANLETQFGIGAVHEDELTAVAVDGDKIVGFVCAWITRGRATPGISGEIDWLWARPDSMRPEIERELASYAVSWLRERGARSIFKMDDIHHPRRELWESVGFVEDVIRFSIYDE